MVTTLGVWEVLLLCVLSSVMIPTSPQAIQVVEFS